MNNNTCLVYLRFNNGGAVQTYHVSAPGKGYGLGLLASAQKPDFIPGADLVEYAVFYSRRTIRKVEAPNFHFMTMSEFLEHTSASARRAEGL